MDKGYLFTEQFTPLEDRIKRDKPQLMESLMHLKELLGQAAFDKYINSLFNLNRGSGMVLLVTGNEMQRGYIERNFVPQLKQAFKVTSVRVVTGGGFAGIK